MDVQPFGERMRAIRQGRLVRQGPKLTLAQVSKAAGISVPHLSQIETGKRWEGRLPPGDDLQKIADALGVTYGELVGNEEQREESERLIAEERVTYDLEKERLAALGRAVLRLVRESAPPTLADVVEQHRRRLQREFSPEMYAKIEITFVEVEAAYERMVGPDDDEAPDDPATPSVGREA